MENPKVNVESASWRPNQQGVTEQLRASKVAVK